jgi:CTP:molybdopterin cytidylyltransferase MocA
MDQRGRLPCILLAAGAGTRMGARLGACLGARLGARLGACLGARKLLLSVDGEPMVRRAVLSILPSCNPVVVVTGSGAPEVEAAIVGIEGIRIVRTPRWSEGRAASAIAGLDALPEGCPGFFLHHADMPFVEARVFALLAEEARARRLAAYSATAAAASAASAEPEVALVAARLGQPGHPVYFPASYIPAIRAVGSGERLRPVLDSLGFRLVETGCDGVVEDMDSPEDYAALIAKYGLGDSQSRAPRV